jgi:hypothetical protein
MTSRIGLKEYSLYSRIQTRLSGYPFAVISIVIFVLVCGGVIPTAYRTS